MIDSLGLFSTNESVDEASTPSLPYANFWFLITYFDRYMSVQYWLAMACQRIRTEGPEDRRHLLLASRSCLDEFLRLLLAYQIIPESECKTADGIDPAVQRLTKIDRMKSMRVLELAIAERQGAKDEEMVREVRLDELKLSALLAVQERALITSELELLAARIADPNKKAISGAARPLPSHLRRVTKPFTLLRTRREDIKSSVFRPGHNLPTMTIDEYLELERQRGGILEADDDGKGELVPVDSDDEDERQRRIRMDNYKDEHRRGSGNTYNRS